MPYDDRAVNVLRSACREEYITSSSGESGQATKLSGLGGGREPT